MNVIDIRSLRKSYGSRTILDEITFTVKAGQKIGIIGANGCGKSTLLRILAGLEPSDGGEVLRKRGLVAAYLPQEPELDPELTIRQTLEGSLAEARQNLHRYHEILEALADDAAAHDESLLEEQHQLQGWLDLHQGWHLDTKVNQICSRFGIEDTSRVVGNLSGGWVKRVALAGILLREPELLLLDEPTNHLDTDTIAWLEDALKNYSGAVMLVTHDRYFLDRVVRRMFEIDGGELTSYLGGYSDYLEQKREKLEQQGQAQSRLANLLRREEAWLHRGAKARTTKQKARIDRVEDLRAQKKTVGSREVRLGFDMQHRLGGTILELCDLEMKFDGPPLFQDLNLIMRKGERIGILGSNGCGKSTLLKTVLDELKPTAGRIVRGKNTRIGYLDQQRSGLDPTQFVHEAVGEGDWVTVAGEKRHKIGYLQDFLFTPEEQRKRISTLSGGERARLLLACMILEGANLLILDEPTNDLDIPTLQVLEEALNDFPGCVLVVTHDRYFLDRIATGVLHFEGGGRVTFYEGNYEIFCRLQAQKAEGLKVREKAAEKKSAPPPREKRRAGLSYKERLELEGIELKIEEREGRKAELEEMLADPSRIGDHNRMAEIGREVEGLDVELVELMERWEELELKKEGG